MQKLSLLGSYPDDESEWDVYDEPYEEKDLHISLKPHDAPSLQGDGKMPRRNGPHGNLILYRGI